MTNTLHRSSQEQATGDGITSPEQNFTVQSLIVDVTSISVNALGSVIFKVQHSAEGERWFDVPNLATAPILATGTTTITLNTPLALLDYQRIVWTFASANRVTFAAYLVGQ